MVARHFPAHSILTVRNPLDSFLSLVAAFAAGWARFQPSTFDEYCKRYMLFLDAHKGLPIFKYETFVDEPEVTMEQMCTALQLRYSASFTETFDVFRFSGDSGRSGVTIKTRLRRPHEKVFLEDAKASASYRLLVDRLSY
jgi:hypothetical protein